MPTDDELTAQANQDLKDKVGQLNDILQIVANQVKTPEQWQHFLEDVELAIGTPGNNEVLAPGIYALGDAIPTIPVDWSKHDGPATFPHVCAIEVRRDTPHSHP